VCADIRAVIDSAPKKEIRMPHKFRAVLLAASCTVLAAGCGSDPSPSDSSGSSGKDFAGQVIRVGTYGGSWQDATKATAVKTFEARTGAKVEFVSGDPQTLAPKIIAAAGGRPPMDIVETDDVTQIQLAQGGHLVTFPKSEHEEIYGDTTIPAAAGGDNALGRIAWYVQVAFNSDEFKKHGIAEPKTYGDLWDPALAGKISIPDITTAMGVPAVMAAAAAATGDPYDYKAGVAKLGELKLSNVYKSSSTVPTDFENGTTWAAIVSNGYGAQMQDAGMPVKTYLPIVDEVGKPGWLAGGSFLDVVKGTENEELAREFIKDAYAPTAQEEIFRVAAYQPGSPTAVANILAETDEGDLEKVKSRLPDISTIASIDWETVVGDTGEIVDLFNREFAG
jgi:putative spermidine/putrescine transport system substrate-binding protein